MRLVAGRGLNSHLLSPDNKTLYLETFDKSGFAKLRIYYISNLTSPQPISEKFFSKFGSWSRERKFSLSSDLKSGFVFQDSYSIKLDLTNLKQPKISGIIPLVWNEASPIYDFLLSPDDQTIYFSYENEIRILNMNNQYTLFLKQEKFMLGEKYSDTVAILNLTAGRYDLIDTKAYKINKLSLLDIKVDPSDIYPDFTGSYLPSWMTFGKGNILTVEPRKQREIGTYTLDSSFSLKIPREIFNSFETAETPAEDLVAWLISLDYIDSDLFLTSKFKDLKTFHLPAKFNASKEEIYNVLGKYHIEACTLFEIVPSLKFEQDTFAVSTLSTSNIKVEIKLESKDGSDAKFVNRHYGSLVPVMRENKTKISLEGSLKEINTALNVILVNFENGTSSDVNMIVNDGLNPPVSIGLKNAPRYFRANQPPALNPKVDKTVQEQINLADIQTGKYFTFAFSNDVFEDDYAENLEYRFVMAKNDTAFPTWLDFNGLTLKGTPPEEISGRDIDLNLIAKNEFKEYEVPLKLHISISAALWLKLMMRYSPYILTLIGLYVKANKIFNILGKEVYKHSKEFSVGVGEEISDNVIFPISFVKEERKQSQIILKQLGDINVTNYIDEEKRIVDKEKIISKMKKTIQNMPVNIKKEITLYPNQIIDQIVVNKFTWMQLDLKSEMKTRSLFEDLKADCLEFIEKGGESSSSEFTINQNKLMKRLKKSSGLGEIDNALEESLISHHQLDIPGVNINLLKDAILAYAFESHSLDSSPVGIDVGVKQKVPSNFLWRFLKCDLKDIYLNEKYRMNYGINYQIMDDKLCFFGISQNYLKGKTLVVQIKTHKQRIMKEIWIHGVSNDFRGKESLIIRDEQEMRGQGYEIY